MPKKDKHALEDNADSLCFRKVELILNSRLKHAVEAGTELRPGIRQQGPR